MEEEERGRPCASLDAPIIVDLRPHMAVIPGWRRKGAIFAGSQRRGSGSLASLDGEAQMDTQSRCAAVPLIGAVVVEVVGRSNG